MKLYEGMFLVDSRKANRDWDSVEEHLTGILNKCGAKIHRISRWAERKLAYPVKKHTRGVYVLTYFETPDEDGIITEIYRQVEISDVIIRALVLRIKEIPPEEAPVEQEEETPAADDDAPVSDEPKTGEEAADTEAEESVEAAVEEADTSNEEEKEETV